MNYAYTVPPLIVFICLSLILYNRSEWLIRAYIKARAWISNKDDPWPLFIVAVTIAVLGAAFFVDYGRLG